MSAKIGSAFSRPMPRALVALVKHPYLSDRSYYLTYPERKSENAALTTFSAWLDAQAREYRDATGL